MLTKIPIINTSTGEILGFQDEKIHILNIPRKEGKTRMLLDNLLEDELPYGRNKILCIDASGSNHLKRQFGILMISYSDLWKSCDIPYMVGSKYNVVYVDEWFNLDENKQSFIINWCLSRGSCYLNAFGSREESE